MRPGGECQGGRLKSIPLGGIRGSVSPDLLPTTTPKAKILPEWSGPSKAAQGKRKGHPVQKPLLGCVGRLVGSLAILVVQAGCSREEPQYLGRPLSHWAEQLKAEFPEERRKAAEAFVVLGSSGASAVPALEELLHDRDPDVRIAVLDALTSIGPEGQPAAPAVVELLADQDERVRYNAAEALGRIGAECDQVIPSLTRLLDDQAGNVRVVAAVSLHQLDPQSRQALPTLVALLDDPSPLIRSRAVFALARYGRDVKPALPLLIRAMNDAIPEVRARSAVAIAGVGGEAQAAVPSLVQAMEKAEYPEECLAEVYALGQIGPGAKEAIPALKRVAARHTDPAVARHVQDTLQLIQRSK